MEWDDEIDFFASLTNFDKIVTLWVHSIRQMSFANWSLGVCAKNIKLKKSAFLSAFIRRQIQTFIKFIFFPPWVIRSSFLVLLGVLTHQSSDVSSGVLPSLYETKLLNKTVFGLKPSTDLRNVSFQFGLSAFWKNRRWIYCGNKATEQTLCYRNTNHLIISSAHLYQWLRVTSGSSSALIFVPSALLSCFLPADYIMSLPTSHWTLGSPPTKEGALYFKPCQD